MIREYKIMLNYNDFDAILFDMDGTIFDSETVHRDAWKITAAQFEQVFTDQMYKQFIGMTTPECMRLAVKIFEKGIDIQAFSENYYENLKVLQQKGVPLKSSFPAYLGRLKKLNKALGIVTSSAASGVQENFTHYDFYSDFKVVISRDDVTQYKPHPAPYLLACKRLGVKPERTIVFEDSNTGATAALDAGCYVVGIPDLVAFNTETANRLHKEIESFEWLL